MTEQPPNFARRRVRRDRHARRSEGVDEPPRDGASGQAAPAPTTAGPSAAPTQQPVQAPAAPRTGTGSTASTEVRRRIERPRRGTPAAGPRTTEPAPPAEPAAPSGQPDSAAAPTTRVPPDPRRSAAPATGRIRRDPYGDHEPSGSVRVTAAQRSAPNHTPGGRPDRPYQPGNGSPRPGEPIDSHQTERSAPSTAPITASPTAPPTASQPAARPSRWQPQSGFRRDTERNERGLRGLIGSGPSQVGLSGAMRSRDAARPTAADLQAAETELVIVRRHYVPPDQLPDAGSEPGQPRGGT